MLDIATAFAQRGKMDWKDVQAKVEVFAECAGGHHFRQVAVGGGDDSDIDLASSGAAQRFELAFLQHAEEFGLEFQRQLADFVEEDGAAVGKREPAFTPGHGAGERAPLVAEEFAFNEVGRDGGAFDEHEGFVRAIAGAMN